MAGKRKPTSKTKVFWSDLEKARIVKRAVDIQAEQPDLEGLNLLRAALDVLPDERRRDLIALSQASWFRRMVNDELKRREMEARLKDDTVSVLREHRTHHLDWMSEQLSRYDKMLPALEQMASETTNHHAAFEKHAKQNDEWWESVLSFNEAAVKLMTETAAATKSHAARAEEWERVRKETSDGIRSDNRKMVELLGRMCGELHDLNLRLNAVEGDSPPKNGKPAAAREESTSWTKWQMETAAAAMLLLQTLAGQVGELNGRLGSPPYQEPACERAAGPQAPQAARRTRDPDPGDDEGSSQLV